MNLIIPQVEITSIHISTTNSSFPFSGSSSGTYITIDVQLRLQHLFITYSNGEPEECESRDLGGSAAGRVKYIPLFPACGNITIDAMTLSTPIESCQYKGPQRNVVVEQDPWTFGCIIQPTFV